MVNVKVIILILIIIRYLITDTLLRFKAFNNTKRDSQTNRSSDKIITIIIMTVIIITIIMIVIIIMI